MCDLTTVKATLYPEGTPMWVVEEEEDAKYNNIYLETWNQYSDFCIRILLLII